MQGRFPFSARWLPDGQLELTNHGQGDLSVNVLVLDGAFLGERLPAGATRSWRLELRDWQGVHPTRLWDSDLPRYCDRGLLIASCAGRLAGAGLVEELEGSLASGVDRSTWLEWDSHHALVVAVPSAQTSPGWVSARKEPLSGSALVLYRLHLLAPEGALPEPEEEESETEDGADEPAELAPEATSPEVEEGARDSRDPAKEEGQ